MSTIIEARRLNGTDIGKTVEFSGITGVLNQVGHTTVVTDETKLCDKYNVYEQKIVTATVGAHSYTLRPSQKITITGKRSPEAGQ
ncbi:hypothetical protein ATC04_00020 [Arthrobacter sp. YC-RL1]|uniref:hypothetical protein n=1 Tax=Arthrobacter sp. YC-RL1 TaxID=1652545 RepID=UPI0007228F01|nr:hypothetical protein [Arthrobacter sp. YC-RL1]ALQ29089.1 hypothetical protein ATC04_00020 [Arthrobacter sp. YC-RL1]